MKHFVVSTGKYRPSRSVNIYGLRSTDRAIRMFWKRLTLSIAVKDGHAGCYVCV